MFLTNLKIAFRNLRRNKLYAGINILGLSIGMTIYIFAGLIVDYEHTHDAFFANSDRTYLVGSYIAASQNLEFNMGPAAYTAVGPLARDHGEIDTIAQLLANRGYAVFQPNFRSSTGFGANYVISSTGEFGDGRVQQDIIDGLNYVLSRGIGDSDKLGIVGGSFGGFSTLNALSFTPETFQVGVASAPPIDLGKTLTYAAQTQFLSNIGLEAASLFFGGASDDPELKRRLYETSPDYHSDQIIRPLYIWAGKQDDSVSILNVKDYALRQREADKDVTLMVDETSGHGPEGDISMEAYMYLIEKAFADHLGERLEEELSPVITRFLNRSVLIDENDFVQEESTTSPSPSNI